MKKFIVAILAFIYLGVSSGIAMNVHYCMGKIASVNLEPNKEKCSKCGMKQQNNGCCKNEFKIVKLNDAHKLISNEVNLSVPLAFLNNHYNYFTADLIFSEIDLLVNNNSPPGYPGISRNILYCVFRI